MVSSFEDTPVRVMTTTETYNVKKQNSSGGKKKQSVMPKNNSFYIAPVVGETSTQKNSTYSLNKQYS